MDLGTKLLLTSLILNILGIIILFFNSPQNKWRIDGGTPSTDWKAIEKATKRRNILMYVGLFLILGAALIQFYCIFFY